MYQPLLERLAGSYRLIAPDYVGFGHSEAPCPSRFTLHVRPLAEIVEGFTVALGLSRYSIYMQDYGGPIRVSTRPRLR